MFIDKKLQTMTGIRFTKYIENLTGNSSFDKLLKLFLELLTITSGNAAEALSWLSEIDKQYKVTDDSYGVGDFIEDLKKNNYLKEDENKNVFVITSKTEQSIRKQSLDEIFGKLKKSKRGNHRTPFSGVGDELTSERREFNFGDSLDQIALTESIKKAQINHGIDEFRADRKRS